MHLAWRTFDDLTRWRWLGNHFDHLTRFNSATIAAATAITATSSQVDRRTASATTTCNTTTVTGWFAPVTPDGWESAKHRTAGTTGLSIVITAAIAWIASVGRMIDPRINVQLTTPLAVTATVAPCAEMDWPIHAMAVTSQRRHTAARAKECRTAKCYRETFEPRHSLDPVKTNGDIHKALSPKLTVKIKSIYLTRKN
jgi:hypothetical protein